MNLSNMANAKISRLLHKRPAYALLGLYPFKKPHQPTHKVGRYLAMLVCLSLGICTPSFADILAPVSLLNKKGSTNSGPISVLNAQDQLGTADVPNKYLQFNPATNGYSGVFKFTVPTNVSQTLGSVTFKANYRGPKFSIQPWVFKLLDVQSGKWVTVADNSTASAWVWSALSKAVAGDPTRFIDAKSQISLQYSTNKLDYSQLDFVALQTTAKTVAVPTNPTPAPVTSTTTTTAGYWHPKPGTSWQIQYTGTINTTLTVDTYNLDLFDTNAATIAALKAKSKHVVCYFSAGSYENWRPDAAMFPAAVLGLALEGWAGERWLDVRQLTTLIPIMKARMQLAASKGCNGVDPDNVDGYNNSTGFTLSYNDQIAYNIAIAQEAHKLGLAVSLKNDLDQVQDLVNYFDFAVNEECYQYNECNLLKPFINAGKPVFGIEYNLSTVSFCPQANSSNFDFLKKNLSLDATRTSCR